MSLASTLAAVDTQLVTDFTDSATDSVDTLRQIGVVGAGLGFSVWIVVRGYRMIRRFI